MPNMILGTLPSLQTKIGFILSNIDNMVNLSSINDNNRLNTRGKILSLRLFCYIIYNYINHQKLFIMNYNFYVFCKYMFITLNFFLHKCQLF